MKLTCCVRGVAFVLVALTHCGQAQAERLVLASASYGKNIVAICDADGKVLWSYNTAGPKTGHAGHHDIQLLDNGDILFHENWTTIIEMTLDKKVVWTYDSSKMNGNQGKAVEVHAFQRLPGGLTMIAESGIGRIIEVDRQGKIHAEIQLKPGGRQHTRMARKLASGNYLVCAENPGVVTEYNAQGEIVWEHAIKTRVYGAIRLKNGNTLIASGGGAGVVEVNRAGKVVWEIKDGVPDTKITLKWTTFLTELDNGNRIVGNCHAGEHSPQIFEITPEKKVVWQFNQFQTFGNGLACSQVLDDKQSALVRKLLANSNARAADWPQFMRDAAHTGDAADEDLRLPLSLAAHIKLNDAVLTSAAVVNGRAYVVDQMGTAYCIDPQANKILWQAEPDGVKAMGFNTSSPCVVDGRIYFGTTAGNFHILDAADGRVLKTLAIGSPIVSAPTLANQAIYFQAIDAVLRCHDLDGNERWRWDHYARYQEPPELTKAKERERGHPGSYDRPHYGGGDVAVQGKRVVTSFGWDIVCLEDMGATAKLVWCNRAPNGRDGSSPMSSSIAGDWIYNTGMGADGHLALTRLALSDGKVSRLTNGRMEAYAWNTPVVRGEMIAYRHAHDGKTGIALFDGAQRKTVASWRDEHEATPFVSSHTLTKHHLLATTLRGELIAFDINAKAGAKPFRYRIPTGKGIGAAPVVADGRVYFGADDGCFYVLAPDGRCEALKDANLLPPARAQPPLKTTWPSTCGNPGNTSFVNDHDVKPPLRVRWATRGFGHFLAPCIATDADLVSVTFGGIITCQEQATGRLRWRRQLPGPEWGTSSGLLATDNRLYIPRPTFGRMEGAFHCLNLGDGQTIWSADIGGRYIWERAAPVLAQGVVAFGTGRRAEGQEAPGVPGTRIQAWDAATGKPAWHVELNVAGNRAGSIAGCTDGNTMYFTAGAGAWQWKQEGDKKRGEAVAIDAKSGKVLWRSNDLFGESYPVLSGNRLFLNGDGLHCVSPADGKLIWKRAAPGYTRFSIGNDFLVMRGYGGHGVKVRLDDGKDYPNCRELGGDTHSCSPVTLTPHYSLAVTVGGLNVRDVKNGELLWRSPGFAPRGCVNPALANGRVFWPSAASGMIYCWEPRAAQRK